MAWHGTDRRIPARVSISGECCLCTGLAQGGVAVWSSRHGEEVWSNREVLVITDVVKVVGTEPLILAGGFDRFGDGTECGCVALLDASTGNVSFKKQVGIEPCLMEYCDIQANVFVLGWERGYRRHPNSLLVAWNVRSATQFFYIRLEGALCL